MNIFLPVPYFFAHLAAVRCFAQELQVENPFGLHFAIFTRRVYFISHLQFLWYTGMC